jgi:hypothetical protein
MKGHKVLHVMFGGYAFSIVGLLKSDAHVSSYKHRVE